MTTPGRIARAALAAALLLAMPDAAEAEDRVVRLWHAYADGSAEERGLHEALDAFESEHEGVRIEILAVAFDAYASKLESAIPTGQGPDVFIDAHERLPTYVRAGLVAEHAPADRFAERPAASEFEPEHLRALTIDGSLHGLPIALKAPAMYVNDDLVTERLETLEQIAALETSEEVYPLVFEAENAYYVSALLHAYGGALLEDGQYAFEGPAAERALGQVRELVRSGVVPEETDGKLVKRLFGGGKAATAFSGPWLAPDLPETLSWHVEPLPRVEGAGGEPMVPFVTVEAALLADEPTHPELARALVEFLAGPEGARIRGRVGRQVVAADSPWQDPELSDDPFLATFREAAARGLPMPTHPKMRMTFEPAGNAITKVLRGNERIEAALAEGARRFADVTRPPPARRDPTIALLALGLVLLLVVVSTARRARDPVFRARLRKSKTAYRYMAHAFIAVGVLVIAPIVGVAVTAFFGGRGMDLHYVGLANFASILSNRGGDLLGHGSFWLVLLVTILWTALNIAFHLGIGVALALVLHRPTLKLKTPYRVLLILPWAVPSYVTALAWKGMFHRQFGAMNALLERLGAEPVSWFAHWSTAFGANVATNVWLGFPFMMVVTLGALAAIPNELYEAAEVDGATAWQRFRHVTLPMLGPSLGPAVAMGAVWTFNMFNVVFLVSGGEPDGSTEILVSEAYRWAFTRSQQYGYAAAYGVLIFGLLMLGSRSFSGGLERTEATG